MDLVIFLICICGILYFYLLSLSVFCHLKKKVSCSGQRFSAANLAYCGDNITKELEVDVSPKHSDGMYEVRTFSTIGRVF